MLALQEVEETIEIWTKFDVNHEGTKTSVIIIQNIEIVV